MAMASFGEKLRREREMRGVSLREIADGTKISVRFLQALEEDRTDVLPGGLFPRAFVKQYALFLGLDPERAAADFVAQHGEAVPERRAPAPALGPRLSLTPGQILLGVLALVVLVVLVRRPGEPDYRRAKAEPTPTPVAAAPAVLPTDRVYPSPSLAPAATTPAGSGGGAGRAARGAGSGGALGAAAAATACRATASAERMSPAEAKRLSRSLSRARLTTATIPVETSGAHRRTGGGCRWTTWKRTLGVESASKGLWPVSSS